MVSVSEKYSEEDLTLDAPFVYDVVKSAGGICLRTLSMISYWDAERLDDCSEETAVAERVGMLCNWSSVRTC